MPSYENPEIPDGINVSHTHPLADFARLVGGLVVVTALVVGLLMLVAGRVAKYVPFETEVAMAGPFAEKLDGSDSKVLSDYVKTVTAKVAAEHDLPPGMVITAHYLPDDTVNAFATLGGHIVIYGGLMREMPDENTLAMVISHEIAHVRLRHPISSMGRGLVFGMALAVVSASGGGSVVSQALGSAGLLTTLSFSRDQERAADALGLDALVKTYGHAAGGAETFRRLQSAHDGRLRPPALLSTHPVDTERIATIEKTIADHGWAPTGPMTPYPADVVTALGPKP